MVLKKPYGLMIKHFKLIHVLLLLLSAFVIWQVRPLVSFFNEFVANNYTASITTNMAGTYINVLLYPALIIIFLLLGMLLILLHYKKKPSKIYSIALIYYIILFVGIIISAGLLTSLEEALWSTTSARMYRDISAIIVLPQYIFIPFWLIRSLGFNIKQFNFQSDLAELDLSQKDSEEIEINLGFETYKYQRMLRRFIREFKYYFTENKFLMIIIFILSLGVMIYLFFTNFEIYEEKVNIGQVFSISNLNVKVEDSIITDLNYNGNPLDKYYLLLRVTISNPSKEDSYALEYNKFLIYSKDDYYRPVTKVANQFIDYGESYYGSKILPETTKTVVIPYEIDKNRRNDEYYLGVYKDTAKKKENYRNRIFKIDLTPVIIKENAIVSNTTLNQEINFKNTYLNNTTLNIKEALVTSRYVYSYETCVKDKCTTYNDLITPSVKGNTSQTLLVLDYDFKLDNDTSFAKLNNKITAFADTFFRIRYTIGSDSYVEEVSAIDSKLKDKLVLQTNAKIASADKIDLLITIRNKTFVINLINKNVNK